LALEKIFKQEIKFMKTKHIAVYLGSFDPVTFGHLDVIERASKLFDHLVVGVGRNSNKKFCFSADERFKMVKKECLRFDNVEVKQLNGLAVEFALSEGARVIVRGLRTEADYAYEMQMAMINKTLEEKLETVFIPTRQSYSHISSSLVKEVAFYGGDVSAFVPASIVEILAPLKKESC